MQTKYDRKLVSLPPGLAEEVEEVRKKHETFSGIVAEQLKKLVSRRKR